MNLRLPFLLLALLCTLSCLAQGNPDIAAQADNLYKTKAYSQAAPLYTQAAEAATNKSQKKSNYYNAACCYAMAQDIENAFVYLNLAIKNGWSDKDHLSTDTDLKVLHADKRWKGLVNSVKPLFNSNPSAAKIVAADIDNFYKAFELVRKDTAQAQEIFKKHYFEKGSIGLEDFYASKIKNEQAFSKSVLQNQRFFASIKPTVTKVEDFKKSIYSSFNQFKDLYPKAVFPDVYFVMGRFTSNGTASDNGLLIGTEVMSKTAANSMKSWSNWQKEHILNYDQIPVTVVHELIHFNQQGMKKENTLLKYALIEGSAEFIAELVTGKTDGNYAAYEGRELQIWDDFKKDMYLNKYDEWLSAKEPQRPRNGMYWAGYQICKSYYAQAEDKKQAVADMLNIKDYLNFFVQSKVDAYMKTKFVN
ncbi:MAG: TPR end-of-group domain-containing protein [Rufibacter sp.]